jgi:gliding motility-associated-like protein
MKLLSPILFFLSTVTFSQGIVIDTTSLSVPDLVHIVLMQNSCSNESNFIFSSHLGIGNFTNTNPSFPFTDGIVIRNGIAKYTEGPYTGANESSQISTSTDLDLQAISISNGQFATITDVGFIQFDFTPLSSNFSFDFLFASNEYGEYQCGFSDVFAFLLTDLTTNSQTNLAVIPGTSTPVTVKNIRDTAYNSSCLSNNAALFSRYNVTDPATSAINMRGETVLLTASSPVIPNRTYRIKLAIGDYFDSNYDSAVFIKGGSFTTTANLGPDKTICQGESVLINSGINPPFTVSWTRNGAIIPGQNGADLLVTQTGTYGVIGSLPSSGCAITDEIIVTDLSFNTLNNVSVCNSGAATYQYNLLQNNLATLGLNATDYSILYFATMADANANAPQIPSNQLNSYTSAGGETIYVKVMHLSNGNYICDNLLSFDLLVNAPIIATTPTNVLLCSDAAGNSTFDLTGQTALVLNGLPTANYSVTYFSSQADAQSNTNEITNPTSYIATLAQSPQTVWVRMSALTSLDCFDIVNFVITVYPKPLVDVLTNVIECHSYFLPVLTNGNYFNSANGSGTMLNAGDEILIPGTYYIFNGPDANGCTNESSFTITLIDQLVFPLTGCGKYTIVGAPIGNFYTGISGTGTLLAAGTELTSSQTIYYYAVINGVVCRDEVLNITVFPLPLVDTVQNVITCNSINLPTLINGNYFTASGGVGTALFAGNPITSSQTLYVYAFDGQCPNQSSFNVTIIDTSIYVPVTSCGSFSIPIVPVGNYYDAPLGAGTLIPAGTSITTSQTVYYFAVTTTTPNCTDFLNYAITINPLPAVDSPVNRLECENYTLPTLTNGNYFSTTGGIGPLSAGDVIIRTQTIYVYAISILGCPNEKSFTVEIREKPLVDNFTDVFSCTDFVLPALTNGIYYTSAGGPNGTGNLLAAGTAISSSQRIYIYNEWSDFIGCKNETFFNIQFSGIDVGTFADVSVCDSYRLPPLTLGDYYSLPNGAGPIIPVGTVLTSSQRIYVYKIVGTRLTCSDQDDFLVTISPTPVLINRPDVFICSGYLLPTLALGNYFSQALGAGTTYSAGQNITTSQQMYIYATAATNATCFDQDDFNITVYPLKNLNINDGVICIDNDTGALLQPYVMNSGLNPAIFTVEWYLNGVLVGTGQRYTAVQEGTYTVVVIKNTPDVGSDCSYNSTTVVVEKSSTAIASITVSAAFVDVIDVIVNVTGGFGDYEFQMDGGAFQTSTIFQNVASGAHAISIKDIKGDCNRLNLIAHVIKYPNYFTPNGDGYHETWNIIDLDFQPDAVLYIYDRYGKFLKQLKTNGPGWDGNYNGNPLPSSDYWFQVFYKFNGADQEFKSHFSMKR